MLLSCVASFAFASQAEIERPLRVAGFGPGANAEDVPTDTVPVIAFEATERARAIVRLVDDASGAVLVEEEHTFSPGFDLIELDPGEVLAAGTVYRVEAEGGGEDEAIRFTTGDRLAEEVPAPEMAENRGVRLSFYDDLLHGLVEVRVGAETADPPVLLLLDEAGELVGVGFPEQGEDVESIEVLAPASALPAEACFTAVARDRAGRETVPSPEACVPVKDGLGLSCASAQAPLGGLLVALGALVAALRRR